MPDAVISLERVSKSFFDQQVIEDLSISVRTGEILALLGQTGAGKSTVLNLVLGQVSPTSGHVTVQGCDPARDYDALRGKVAVSFQSDRLIPWRTACGNVELGLEILRRPKPVRRALSAEWLDRVKLARQHHDKYPHQLSGGMRQRVSLARALVIDPDVVLLDESFSQLDHVTSKELRADFLALVKQLKKTCMLITHRIDDALEMADRIILMAPPGRIQLEIALSDADRGDRRRLAELTRGITATMALSGLPAAESAWASDP